MELKLLILNAGTNTHTHVKIVSRKRFPERAGLY